MLSSLMRLIRASRSKYRHHLPDSVYLKLTYHERTGKQLNLRHPVTFGDKINWLKLNYKHKHLIELVDKYQVREHIAQTIGRSYLIPNHAVFNTVSQINSDTLPEQFVLKPNHGSGWVICCTDKSTLDWPQTLATLDGWMKKDYSLQGKEWPYAYVPRKIICQELLPNDTERPLIDYRFFCTQGQVHFCQVDCGYLTNPKRFFYDTNWQPMAIQQRLPTCKESLPRPDRLDEMLNVASKLSHDLPFARIDLYNPGQQIFFGEITLYPGAGYIQYEPEVFNTTLGNLIKLPKRCRKLSR